MLAGDFGNRIGGPRRRRQAKDRPRAVQGIVDVLKKILDADDLVEADVDEGVKRLGVDSGEEQSRPLVQTFLVKLLQGVQPRGVDRGDAAHAEDEDLGRFLQAAESILQAIGYPKEERSVDFINLYTRRNLTAIDRVGVFRLSDVVFAIAELLDGYIFNGSEMLDKNGEVILSAEDESEI